MKNTNQKVQKKTLRTSGSFFNYLMSNNESVPVVGEGATIMLWTDRKVADVIEISEDGMRVVIEYANAKNLGEYGDQMWEFTPSGIKQTLVWRQNAWRVETEQVVYTKKFIKEANDNGHCILVDYLDAKYPGLSEEVYQGNVYPTKEIDGITKRKKCYSKINILFGARNYYYDWSF